MTEIASRVDAIARSIVQPHADSVDRGGLFPEAAVAALAESGLLGLVSAPEVGGLGAGPREAVRAVERLARECASTATVFAMHLCGAHVIEKYGAFATRCEIAAGRHLSTIALSDPDSPSPFWAPGSTATHVEIAGTSTPGHDASIATRVGEHALASTPVGTPPPPSAPPPRSGGGFLPTRADPQVRLDGRKREVASAGRATAYVWSSRPLGAPGLGTLWLVPGDVPGLTVAAPSDGLGLRGSGARHLSAEGVLIAASAQLGPDGGGFEILMSSVLPWFNLLSSGIAVGIAEAAAYGAAAHATATRYEHADLRLRDLPTIRASIARMRCRADEAHALVYDAVAAVETGRPEALLRVLQSKAVAAEAALAVTTLAMQVCGEAAYRKEVGVERRFRDAHAASVIPPTTDVLYDCIGRAVCAMEPFGAHAGPSGAIPPSGH